MSLYEKLDSTQKRAVRLAIANKSAAIFFEQGVGKTHPALAVIEILAEEDPKFCGAFVVPLTNIETTWYALIKAELPQINVTADWNQFKKLPFPKLYVVHYESLPKVDKKISKYKWTFFGFDESQRLKARGSRQSRIAGRIRDVEYRVILSGTPIDESPIDLWAQFRFVRPQLFGNDKGAWKRFDESYLKPTGYMGYQRKFRDDIALKKFLDKIKPFIIRVDAADVLNLPPCEEVMRGVEMWGKQKRLYNQMERDCVIKLIAEAKVKKRKRVSAGLKITQMIKLQQICGGFVIDDDGETHTFRSVKLDELDDLITSGTAELPMVIFCKYKEELNRAEALVKSLGLRYGLVTGKVRDKKFKKARTEVINKFQSGQLDVVICQTRTGGVGVDFYMARSGIFYSTTFSYIDFEQCKKRIHRRGQKNPTKLFFIYVKDSIDEDIYLTLLSKRSVNKSIFNPMKRRSLRHG